MPATPNPPRCVSCGCCSNGCTCWIHQDITRGLRAKTCSYHADPAHPHPHVTDEPLTPEG